jgi:hypothetical protein
MLTRSLTVNLVKRRRSTRTRTVRPRRTACTRLPSSFAWIERTRALRGSLIRAVRRRWTEQWGMGPDAPADPEPAGCGQTSSATRTA